MRHRPELDGLRGVAILLVLALHTQISTFRAGGLGVDVFFSLSGYLITALLLDERERTGSVRFGAFYARRAARLFPALVLGVLLGFAVLTAVLHHEPATVATGALIGLGYLTDLALNFGWGSWGEFGHLWSLAVEEQFYLLWPTLLLIVLRWGHRAARLLLGALLVCSLVTMEVVYTPLRGGPPWTYFSPIGHVCCLLMGCIAAVLPMHRAAKLGPVGIVGLAALVAGSPGLAGGTASSFYFRASIPLAGVTTCLIIAAGEQSSRWLAPLRWSVLRWFGAISYGLYVYHPFVFDLISAKVHHSRTFDLLISIPLSVLLAAVSLRLVEQPIRSHVRARLQAAR